MDRAKTAENERRNIWVFGFGVSYTNDLMVGVCFRCGRIWMSIESMSLPFYTVREDLVLKTIEMFIMSTGPRLKIKKVFPSIGISMIKTRLSWDRLIFIMGTLILVRQHLYIIYIYIYIYTGPRKVSTDCFYSSGNCLYFFIFTCESLFSGRLVSHIQWSQFRNTGVLRGHGVYFLGLFCFVL